jgi:hypothetical protein
MNSRRRDDLWKRLAEATDAVTAAMSDYLATPTPQTRTRMETASRDYIDRLVPVIGEKAAFEFQDGWDVYIQKIDRRERLLATLSGQPDLSASDVELLDRLKSEIDNALKVFEATAVAMQTRLDNAARADDQCR